MRGHHAKITRCTTMVLLVLLFSAPVMWAEDPGIGLIYAARHFEKLVSGEDRQDTYRRAIESSGGRVIALGQPEDPLDIEGRLPSLRGLVVPGGIDVCPQLYEEEPSEKLEKTDADLDRFESMLLEYAEEQGLPVLGVCRGHQLLNVHYGGSLIQDIPSEHEAAVRVVHRSPPLVKALSEHAITIHAESRLRRLLGVDRLVVNSAHHQAVERLAPGFLATAWAEDGLVEAMERLGPRFVVGIQFHPEKMLEQAPCLKALFQELVAEARKVKERLGPPASPGFSCAGNGRGLHGYP